MENLDTQLENLQNAMKRHPIATGLVGLALVLIVARIWGGSFEDAHKQWTNDYLTNLERCSATPNDSECKLMTERAELVVASRCHNATKDSAFYRVDCARAIEHFPLTKLLSLR
jgi:hypothetical protein